MSQETMNLLTIVLSTYGAFIATISIFISLIGGYVAWLAYHRDNSKIKVKVFNGYIVPKGFDDGIKIFINAINQGRRPVTLTNAGFLLNDNTTLITLKPIGVSFPHELTEGKSCSIMYDQNELIDTLKHKYLRITHAWVDDATGKRHKKKYKLPRRMSPRR